MENSQHPKVSVLIVTFNNSRTIKDCLDSLINQDSNEIEILVFDNNSTDRTIAILNNYELINVVESSRNLGFAATVNRLAALAKGEFLFILNPDCQCPPGLIKSLLAFAQQHPGAISPALTFPDGSIQPSAREFPDYNNIIFARRSPLYLLGFKRLKNAGFITPSGPTRVPVVSATALLVPKKIFDEIGRFDERFFLYFEDIDLCKRLNQKGIDIWYLPDIKIIHQLRASSQRRSFKALFYHHLSVFKYFTKHYPQRYIKNSMLAGLLLISYAISALFMVLIPRRSND